MPMNLAVTTTFSYIRFHGLEGGAAHDYTRRELKSWAEFICEQAERKRDIYVYFNNDVNVRAPENAKMLMEMIGDHAVQPTLPNRLRFETNRVKKPRRVAFGGKVIASSLRSPQA